MINLITFAPGITINTAVSTTPADVHAVVCA
jgi:hypothetical protein